MAAHQRCFAENDQIEGFGNMQFSIIYADPPWSYRDKAAAGKRGVSFKYDTMDLAGIKALPVPQIAAANATLFLWATMPLLREAFEVLAAWGFTYKTVAFVWTKLSAKSRRLHWGMGNWTRANAELCLLGVRGRPKRINAGVHQIIQAPVREHSRKPDEARSRIVQLVGDLPRIELFATEKTDGWVAVGRQIDGIDIHTALTGFAGHKTSPLNSGGDGSTGTEAPARVR
jgi:N6-adenosine-specific RNA methylase IME4